MRGLIDSMSSLDDILTDVEAAKKFKISVKQLLALARRGQVPGIKVGRSWRFKATELEKLFQDWQPNSYDPNKRAAEIIKKLKEK